MTRINGTDIIETQNGASGYVCLSAALVNAACDFFFRRRGMSPGCDHNPYKVQRYPSGKKRPEGPRIVRVKRIELSRAKRRDNGEVSHRD